MQWNDVEVQLAIRWDVHCIHVVEHDFWMKWEQFGTMTAGGSSQFLSFVHPAILAHCNGDTHRAREIERALCWYFGFPVREQLEGYGL